MKLAFEMHPYYAASLFFFMFFSLKGRDPGPGRWKKIGRQITGKFKALNLGGVINTGWWQLNYFLFSPLFGEFPFWLIFFQGFETTN